MGLPVIGGSDGAWGTALTTFLGGAAADGTPTIPNNRIPYLSGGNLASSANLTFDGTTLTVDTLTVSGDLAVNGGDLTSSATTFNLLNATVTTGNFLGAGTAITMGATSGYTNLRHVLFINTTSNANMTLGITIRQGAADNEAVALGSSDVAHGITGQAETDIYATMKKVAATLGGMELKGLTSGVGPGLSGLGIITTADTAKTTAAVGAINFSAYLKSGSSVTTLGAEGNIMTFQDQGSARFIFDVEGDSFEDGSGWTAFDKYDDVQLLDRINSAMLKAGDPIRGEFWSWIGENAMMLQKLKLVYFNEDGHHFINRSKMQELLVGVARQLGRENVELRSRLDAIEQRVS